MKYRIVQTRMTPDYAEFSIQRRVCFMWFDMIVPPSYLASLETAKKYLRFKKAGWPVNNYYYE